MKRFVVPPTWPSPPRRSWVPPKAWRPDPSWPAPPEGWRFWVDGRGNAVHGRFGRYGGPSRKVLYAGVGGLVFFLGVNIWAMSAVGLLGGDSGSGRPQAVRVVDDSSPTPSETLTPVVPPRTTLPTQVPPPVQKATVTPTRTPTATRTTEKKSEDRAEPTPTRSTTATKTVRPSVSPSPTDVNLLRLYCIQKGWDPEWCDPNNWPQDPPPSEPRSGR